MRWSTFWSRQLAAGSAQLDDYASSAVVRPDLHFNLYDMRGISPWHTTYGPGRRDSRMSYMWYSLRVASTYWRKGWRVSGMRQLGKGLHAIQDTYAHGNAHPLVHLADTGRNAMWRRVQRALPWAIKKRRTRYSHFDNPHFKPWRVRGTENITVWCMRGFRNRTGF